MKDCLLSKFFFNVFVYAVTSALTTVICFSQKNNFPFPSFEKITTAQGLSNNISYRMLQDSKGFLWFPTYSGLNRFDGYEFENYGYDPADQNSITPGFFFGIDENKNGVLWICCGANGMYSFDPATKKFNHYRHDPGNINSLSDNETLGLQIDRNGMVWIATRNGLDAFNPKTNLFTHYNYRNGDFTYITQNNVSMSCMDEDDNLWLLLTLPWGVDYFNTRTGKVIKHFFSDSLSNIFESRKAEVYSVNRGRNGNIWISTKQNGLVNYNTRSHKLIRFLNHESNPDFISDGAGYISYEDSHGNIWMGFNNGQLNFYDHINKKVYKVDSTYLASISFGGATQILEDRSKKIWFMTDNGIYTVALPTKKFISFHNDVSDKNSIASDGVLSFLPAQHEKLLVGSSGADYFDHSSQTFSHLEIIEHGKNILDNAVWSMYRDSKEMVWFATFDGLISYNEKTKTHHRYQYVENDTTSLSASSATSIIEDNKGRYWVTTFGGGLDAFDPVSGKFRALQVHNGTNSISTNSVGSLFKDSHGLLYLGSWGGGMITFNPDSETFKIYKHNANDPSSIGCDIVMHFMETNSGIIWLGTLCGGFNAFNPSTGQFRAFTTKDGLCDDVVNSFALDNKGNFWIGTGHGISCFTPPANPFDQSCCFRFRNYDVSDGLPSNEMFYCNTYKDAAGNIYFGTESAGMFYFNPDDLKDNEFLPPVYITDFKLFNHPVSRNDSTYILSSTIEDTKEIKLTYKQNVFSFAFAALNYIHPEKNQYAYILEGFDKEWIHTDATKRFANYTNLDAGEYIFKVKGSNNDDVWNENYSSIKLIITPPYWETICFRCLILILIVAIVYSIYKYRLQQVVKLQMMRNSIASDLHDDIGSTLNSISVLSEVSKQEAGKEIPSLDEIGISARKIIESMSDIVWTINPENDTFEKVIVRMRSFSYQILKAKKIEFSFKAEALLNKIILPVQVRKNLYLIFKEAINNLVKYSDASRVAILISVENGFVILNVRDNGKGFDLAKDSDGNGLINMKRRADEIKAQLKIESSKGTGTNIELILKT